MALITLSNSYTTVSCKNRSTMMINANNSIRLISISSRYSKLVNRSIRFLRNRKLLVKTLNRWKIYSNNLKILAKINQIWVFLLFQSFLQIMKLIDKMLGEKKVFWIKLWMGLTVGTFKVRIAIWFYSSSILS